MMMPQEFAGDWPQRRFEPLPFPVGPCAWRVTMLPAHAEYIRTHPSLVVVTPADDESVLRAAQPHLGGLPVMLGFEEPPFARAVRDTVLGRMTALGRDRVDVLTMWVDQTADLKGGSVLQVIRALREEGRIDELGLAHHDVREAEWLALRTTARLLAMPYHLGDQAARYRALEAAREHGMACLACGPMEDRATAIPDDEKSLRFALAEHARGLPVLDAPLPPGLTPMSTEEVEAHWKEYRAHHAEPAPLPRSVPPEAAG
jgi:hypothetical protein